MHAGEATGIVQTGLEVFLNNGLPQLSGQRVGLITNYTGVNRHLRSTADLLFADKRIRLRALFGPEHGILGNVQDGIEIDGSIDQRTELPVYSLFGKSLRPTSESLKDLDALIFDIQDVGARYYTYISTMAYAQAAADTAELAFVVLDRPNPITGTHVEGNILDPNFTSFIGVDTIPTRHGMTVGELARFFAAKHGWSEPIVIPMQGWQRQMWFNETHLPWIQPSPNLPTLDTAILYPGTCLIEGTNLSEGRGTTRPFELIGAPWLDPFKLAEELEQRSLPGVAFRPAYFTPNSSKHKHSLCAGVQVHIVNRDLTRPVELGLYLLHTVRKLNPDAFVWHKDRNGVYSIDHLLGSDQPRLALEAGAEVGDITAGWSEQIARFKEHRQPFLLYESESSGLVV